LGTVRSFRGHFRHFWLQFLNFFVNFLVFLGSWTPWPLGNRLGRLAVNPALQFLLVLFIAFFFLPVSVMCNDVEELNQGMIKENVTISYNHTFTYLTASFGGPLVKGIEFHVSVASQNR